ncbi:hypothetical protein BOSE127_140345 [Bosea sp. 127]|nr:hypothetical protein BOSE127_140345 [Bosea sp. 127]
MRHAFRMASFIAGTQEAFDGRNQLYRKATGRGLGQTCQGRGGRCRLGHGRARPPHRPPRQGRG